ncbi:FRG domain-containing protein, partial [bacterium]
TREPKYLNNEMDMYFDILSLKPDAFINDHSVYDRLITMQHYGMPTRLLDITRNPLVAIFFACNNLPMARNDGVIFTFKPENRDVLNFEDSKLKSLAKLFDKNCEDRDEDELLNSICFIKGVAKNQRINNQSGDFIFVGNGKNIAQDLYNLTKLTIIIDAPTKKVLLEQLETLNIHGGSVYPDLTHMSNYISHKYLDTHNLVNKDLKIELDLTAFRKTLGLKIVENESGNSEDLSARSKNKEVEQLTTDFDSNTFWSDQNNMKLFHLLLAAVQFAPLALFAQNNSAEKPLAQLKTANGILEGTTEASGIRSFKGIPFAKAPVGDLRWKEPQPPENWSGVRKADHFGANAMQKKIFGDMLFRSSGMSEDCLFLNVWTPAKSSAEKLPVLVYFFGGGFVAGDGSEGRYDGESMAKKGIVTLTVN